MKKFLAPRWRSSEGKRVWPTRVLPIVTLFLIQATNGQSLRQTLEPRLTRLSRKNQSAVLLWDLSSNTTLASVRAEVFTAPRCLGSLVKPFLLLAYLNELNDRCGRVTSKQPEALPCGKGDGTSALSTHFVDQEVSAFRACTGRVTAQCPVECWFKPGHGKLDLTHALASSCNQYFYQLAKQTPPSAFFKTLAALGINADSTIASAEPVSPETMMGLDSRLRLAPLHVLKAYGKLISEHPSMEADALMDGHARSILLGGLSLGAVEGTSALAERALRRNHHLIGKTGTSPALVGGRYVTSRTDGWFCGFYPARQPTLAVIVYYPGGLGARDAAPLGGQAIRMYLDAVTSDE